MSGGVDSSVAAALMVEAGYDVTGIMLKLWRGEAANLNSGCCNLGAAEDARRVADVLDIPFYVLNMVERFEESVIKDFNETYAAGSTPNPCVRCNSWIKFDTLLSKAKALGADLLVTGHYARVRAEGDRFELLRGIDVNKDQSYVLWMLDQAVLSQVRFPVGEMKKSETRERAARLGLRTAAKPDSQEICFVAEGDLAAYVAANVPAEPGPIVDTTGTVIGRHEGISRYTVGQRKGLGISLGHPVFVHSIDAPGNTLVVGTRDELGVSALTAKEMSFVGDPMDDRDVLVQYRSHGEVFPARLELDSAGDARVEFETPVEAVATGQSVVFYDSARPEMLLGGGIISSTSATERAA